MPLASNTPRHVVYFETNSALFDTCGFTWFATAPDGMASLERLLSTYRILVPTPVLYELAFGPDDLVGRSEAQIRQKIHDSTNCIDTISYAFASRQGRLPSNGFLVVNPGFNEWWTARTRLLTHVRTTDARPGKAKREYSLDALIHATARNCFAPICTANLADFEKLNAASRQAHHDGSVPLFHPECLIRSVTEMIQYEDAV